MIGRNRQTRCLSYLFILLSLLCCVEINAVFATNLGVEGSVYPIAEPDMLTGIYQQLSSMEKDGELERQNQAVLRRSVQHILRPPPVAGVSDLPAGQVPTERYFDPSIVLNKDISNVGGDIIAKKGTRVNPLDTMSFNEMLVFINGDNPQQLNWVAHFIKKDNERQKTIKVILVNGNISDSANAIHRRVYFDQYGGLCHHFKITHTPTLIYQPESDSSDSKRLVVKEIRID